MNRFHPVYHSYTHLSGSRIDMERVLEADLLDEPEEIIDTFSEPPRFFERLSPVGVHLGSASVKGRNWTEMMIRCYQHFNDIFSKTTNYLRQTLEDHYSINHMLPFMSLAIDTGTLNRMVDYDFEEGENSYTKLMELFESGVISPTVTPPFHVILPLLPRPIDRRLCIRIAFFTCIPMLRLFRHYLKEIDEKRTVIPFWAPEAAVTTELMKMIHDEFRLLCNRKKIRKAHLVLLLSSDQARGEPLDTVMKRWCKPSIPEMQKDTTVIFCDPTFSTWMVEGHPSVKKMIDRTIAKVDVNLSEKEVDFIWSHFENLEALTASPKATANLEQRLIKLCEMNYLPVSPDTFALRKLNGSFGVGEDEPLPIDLSNRGPLFDPYEDGVYTRWRGWGCDIPNKRFLAMPNEPYTKKAAKGTVKRNGSPCWKIAWNQTHHFAFQVLTGKPMQSEEGIFGLLNRLTGVSDPEKSQGQVEDFLVEYALVHYREHFTQHDLTEADIQIDEIAQRTLRKGGKAPLEIEECVAAACAAQAYYFGLEAFDSYGLAPVNFDQRGMYQNAAMFTLAFCNATAAFHYLDDAENAQKMADAIQRELIDFQSAYERYDLQFFSVDRATWDEAIRSEIPDSRMNVVERAARRTAARHLADFPYAKDFLKPNDEEITSNVDHIWTTEVNNGNYRWANPLFCGVHEE